ncbi:MAG: hypothetical protein ACLS8R_05885 [Anaeromassilibacillus sp.]
MNAPTVQRMWIHRDATGVVDPLFLEGEGICRGGIAVPLRHDDDSLTGKGVRAPCAE